MNLTSKGRDARNWVLALAIVSGISCRNEPAPFATEVDPRIELIGVVQYLSGYQLSTRFHMDYTDQIEEHFGSYREHPAVEMFRIMSEQGFALAAVPTAMLTLTDPPRLDQRVPRPLDVVLRAGGDDAFTAFVRQLRDFAVESDFMGFFNAHRPLYDSLVTATIPRAEDAVGILSEYLGAEITDATLVLGLTLHHGGYTTLFETGRRREVYAVIGPSGTENTLPTFGDARRIGRIAWHDFAHTVVNDLTAEQRDWVDRNSFLFDSIAPYMPRQGVSTWEMAINEHVVRAVTIRLMSQHLGPEVGNSALSSDLESGFGYLPRVLNALNRYEQNRMTYPTLGDFYSELLETINHRNQESAAEE